MKLKELYVGDYSQEIENAVGSEIYLPIFRKKILQLCLTDLLVIFLI